MKYYQVVLRIDDEEELDEDEIENAVEDTLEYLPYDLVGRVIEVEEVDEDI